MFLLLIDGYLHFRFLMLFTSTLIFPNSAVLYLFFNRQGAIREPTAVLNMCLSRSDCQALKVTIHSVDGSLAKICCETSIKGLNFRQILHFLMKRKSFQSDSGACTEKLPLPVLQFSKLVCLLLSAPLSHPNICKL